MRYLFQESGNNLSLFEETEIQSKCVSHNGILQSKYKLLKKSIQLKEVYEHDRIKVKPT